MAVIITGPGEVTSPLRKAQHSSWSCRTRHVSNCPSATGTQKASSVTPTRSASQLHKQSQIKTAGSLWSHCNRCVASAPSCLFLRVFFFFFTSYCPFCLVYEAAGTPVEERVPAEILDFHLDGLRLSQPAQQAHLQMILCSSAHIYSRSRETWRITHRIIPGL